VLDPALNLGYEPPLRGHDRERDGQARQPAIEGDHRDDAGNDPERGDNPDRDGDCVVGVVASGDDGVPHVRVAASWAHRLI